MSGSVFKFGYRLLWGRLTGKKYPFLVTFNVTNRCNSRCQYCYATYYSRPSNDMPLERVKAVVDDLARAGMFRVNIAGGEPLLRTDIGEIVAYIRRKGVHCAMTTNGVLAHKKIDVLKMLDSVCFSIDGRREGNDLNRGAGMFDRAIAGLEVCKMAGVPVQLSAVLTRHTVHDVDFMVALAEKYGCKVGFATLIRQAGENHQDDNDLLPADEDTRAAFAQIIELKKRGKPVLFSSESYGYALKWPDYTRDILVEKDPGFDSIYCYAGRYFCVLDYNGDLYPCPQLIGSFKPGNVFRDGVQSAFDRASDHHCRTCSVPCTNEFSLFFGLNQNVLLERLLDWVWRQKRWD